MNKFSFSWLRTGLYALSLSSVGTAFAAGQDTANGDDNTLGIITAIGVTLGALSAFWANINNAKQSSAKMVEEMQGSHFTRLDREIVRLTKERDDREKYWREELSRVEQMYQDEITSLKGALELCKNIQE